jgi:hypothetical protein
MSLTDTVTISRDTARVNMLYSEPLPKLGYCTHCQVDYCGKMCAYGPVIGQTKGDKDILAMHVNFAVEQ